MAAPWLSDRQQTVLRRLWDGQSLKEIAGELGVAESTVQTHLVKLRRKFHARTNLHLCRQALAVDVLKP